MKKLINHSENLNKTIVRYFSTATCMLKLKKKKIDNAKSWWGLGGKDILNVVGEIVKWQLDF